MSELGESEKDINAAIASLVSKGLPVMVKKALDVVRVVGNNAVHPGEIDLNDDTETALAMFNLINLIVTHMITQPKEIDQLFNHLPSGAREAIERRDDTSN